VVSHDFLGYGIESTDFPNYSDVFAQNLLHSISERIGSPVNLRIGGTSMCGLPLTCAIVMLVEKTRYLTRPIQ